MDVISNATENRNKCDDHSDSIDISKTLNASNENTDSSSSLFIDKNIDFNKEIEEIKKFDAASENFNNRDTEENNFLNDTEIVVKTENENVVKKSLDITDNSKYTHKSNTSISNTEYKTKYIRSYIEKNPLQDIYKITPNETSDKSGKILSLAENNNKTDKFTTYTSNRSCPQISIEIEDPQSMLSKKSSQLTSKSITSRKSDEEMHCKSDIQMFEPDSCFITTEKCTPRPATDNSFHKNIKLNPRCVSKNQESYERKDSSIKNEYSISTYNNNSEVIDSTGKFGVNYQNINDNHILPVYNYGIENAPKNHRNVASYATQTLPKHSIQDKVKNHQMYDSLMIPCYKEKLHHEISSSNVDKKNSKHIGTKTDFINYNKDKIIFEMRPGNNNNVTNLCKKNIYDVVTPTSTSNINQDIKEFVKESKTNDDGNQFFNKNSTINSYDTFQITQPNYEKYKIEKQIELQNVGGHEKYNLNVPNVFYTDTLSNTKNNFNINSHERERICEIKSESSWNNNDDTQKKSIENSLVHPAANRYNSNIRIIDDNCPKFNNQLDRNLSATKHYPTSYNNTSDPSVESLISLNNKLPSYANSYIHIKRFTKKSLPLATSENKCLTQLQMNPPDFSKITLSTQKENEISLNSNEHNSTTLKKKISHSVTSQNFDELSKKFNYIKDLQLKNPNSNNNNNEQTRFKESFKPNFDFQRANSSYSNLYVKTPNFSTDNFNKSEKIQKINNNNFISTFNTDPNTILTNDLSTIDTNILHSRNYQELAKNDKSVVGPNIQQYTGEMNKTNLSNEFHNNNSKNNSYTIETKIEPDNNNEYYQKKCRTSDQINQYYSTKQLYREENLTSIYKDYNQDDALYSNASKSPVHTEQQFPHNYYQYENGDRIKRTTSVIQSGKQLNLNSTSNFIGNKTKDSISQQSIPTNWNEKSIQQDLANCLCQQQSPSLNHTYNQYINNPQIMGGKSSTANVQNSINTDSRWQTKNDDGLHPVSQHLDMVQNVFTKSSLPNSTYSQRSQNHSPLTKTIIKQLKKSSVPLALDMPQLKKSCTPLPLDMPQSYYNPIGSKDQHHHVPDMAIDSSKYNARSRIENNSKQVKGSDVAAARPAHTGSLTKCTPDMSRILQKPNYREMINHVYAMRNSTTEDDLNLQIIKRTLNYDISLRKPENDLRQNNFDQQHHASKKLSSTYSTQNSSSGYYPSCDEKKIIFKNNHFNMEKSQIGYIESHKGYTDQPYNMSMANNSDISVTFSNVTKSKEIKLNAGEKKNNMNLNSDYSKAIITKVVNKKTDSLPLSRHQMTLGAPTSKKTITAPLDLSVKTVKTKADSTGCDDGNIHSFIPITEGSKSAPKFVFQPNFSNSVNSDKEKNIILQSVTCSEKLKNTHNRGTYSNIICQTNNDRSGTQEYDPERKCYFKNLPSQLNFSSDPHALVAPKTNRYDMDELMININNSKLKVPLNPIADIKIDRKPIYTEYNNDHQIAWQQNTRTQNFNTIQINIVNNNDNDLCETNRKNDFNNSKIHKYENTFFQTTKDLNSVHSKKVQIDSKIQNNIIKNIKIPSDSLTSNTQIIPASVNINQKLDVDYSMRKRPSDITRQITAKKIRVDDIYKAHLEEQTKEALNRNFIVNTLEARNHPIISDNLEQNHRNNEQIPFGGQTNPKLPYCQMQSEKMRKKIWYPPGPETKYNQENVTVSYFHQAPTNKILLSEPVNVPTCSLLINSTPRGADQNVISKLKNSLEMRENEKQKLIKLAENNSESSKSDIASLLAARIRTKGELKGFHPPIISDMKNIADSKDTTHLNVIKTAKQIPENIDDVCQYEQNSVFNLLDWRSACNDFVEQLICGGGGTKKPNKKPNISKMDPTNAEKEKTIQSQSEIDYLCDMKNCFANQIKPYCMMSESSDEDKPLLLLRQQNNSQSNNDLLIKHTDSDKTIESVGKDALLKMCKELPATTTTTTHNSIVEKLSEKIGRNIREKQRIELEKRLAARLGKTSSSESEDNKRNPRPKKSKLTKTRSVNGVSNRDLSDTDSSGTESISMNKNIVRNREMLQNNKYRKLENIDCKIQSEQFNIDSTTNQFTEKQIMTKAEMKFMVPSKEIENNILEESKKDEIQEENVNNSNKINSSNYKTKIKKLSLTTSNKNTEIQLEETMTRSKRRKALENQIANSKILRNDKVIKYIYVDRTNKKPIDKKQAQKNLKESKNLLYKSKTDKKNLSYKNENCNFSSASSVGEFETVSDRLRPRILPVDNNRNNKKSTIKIIKGKMYMEKKNTTPHTKRNLFKKKKIDKYNTSSKFPPGWEDQVYEYKKSLKIPLRLITIKGSHNHRISTSLPDLDSHSSDDTINAKKKMNSFKSHQEPMSSINDEKLEIIQPFTDKVDVDIEEKNSPPKSIIDVLHSRVIRSKKIVKKNVKTVNNKILNRSTNEVELLSTPIVNKATESLDEHHNVFKTEILKSRTRTETRNLKNQELIREVFGGEDRPASAPPEIRNMDKKQEIISFEKKYEEYLQKMNVDFGERIRKNNKTIVTELKDIKHDTLNKNHSMDVNNLVIKPDKDNDAMQPECIKNCIDNFENVKGKTVSIIRDDDVIPNLFKHKRNNKYRRKGSSGFDYIRKKKKPPSSTLSGICNQEHLKRKKPSPIEEFHHGRDENDVCKEIQKWVLNKSVGQSALHKAARLGYLDVIVYCLERMGMNPDPKDNAGYTPLHEACSKGRLDIARVLLQYGANHSETAHSGIRPLHEASENGYIEIVRLLLSYGADPLLTTYSGQTPLMLSESNEMEQFLKNHLYDVQNTGPHKQPWKFPGPWKIFDPYKYGYDVLTGAPNFEQCSDVKACEISDKSFEKENTSLTFDIINKNKFIFNSSSCGGVNDEKIKTAATFGKKQKYLNAAVKKNESIKLEEGEIFQIEEADIPPPPLYLLKDEGNAKWVLLSDLCNLLKVKSKDTLLKQICPSTPPSTINKELLRELKMSDFLEKATCLQLLCAGEKLNIRASKVILVKYNERVQTLLGVKTVVMKF